MISLARKLEHFVNIFCIFLVPTCIFILTFNVDLDFKNFVNKFDSLALWVIKTYFFNKITKKWIWNVIICDCVSVKLELVEVISVIKDVCEHALIIDECNLNYAIIVMLHRYSILGFYDSQTWIII